jgi:hypothetical protein
MAIGRICGLVVVSIGIIPGAGCGRAEEPHSPPQASKSVEQTLIAPLEETIADRLKVAGIDDPGEVRRFLDRLRSTVLTKDRSALAAMLRYPFTRYYKAGIPLRRYDSAAELVPDYDRVFTPRVIQAAGNATFDSLFANYQGAMIGDGEIWFGSGRDGIKIIAINSQF